MNNEDQFEIQREMLELSIKAGRRMMHDFRHLLSEIKEDIPLRKEWENRLQMWESIFYPDDGMKNYRAELHREIQNAEWKFERAVKQLKEHGIEYDDGLPF